MGLVDAVQVRLTWVVLTAVALTLAGAVGAVGVAFATVIVTVSEELSPSLSVTTSVAM